MAQADLTETTDLATMLTQATEAGEMNPAHRECLVDQALLLILENYVHLPLKEAMHGVDPVQRLRLIKHRLREVKSEYEFHLQMLNIFNSLRDLHTNYLLPDPYGNRIAFLPFDIEEYFDVDEEDNPQPYYIATHFVKGFYHKHFKGGVEINTWNGVPIRRAIEILADQNAGSNRAARIAWGIQRLTLRPLRTSLPPDELWIDIGYTDLDGEPHIMRQEWLIARSRLKRSRWMKTSL